MSVSPTSKVTLQSIADHLGVSKFAVSRALAGKPGVSEDTRQSILNAAQRFGYSLRKRAATASRTLEILFHDRDDANSELWLNVQRGVQAEATEAGYATLARWSQRPDEIAELGATAAGLVLVGRHTAPMLEAVRQSRLPHVLVGGQLPYLAAVDRVGATDAEAGGLVGEYLAGLGHRRLLYIHGQPGLSGRLERLRGLREALASVAGSEVRELAFDEKRGEASFRVEFLRLVEAGFAPSAIFCANDGVAVTVVSELLRLGLRIPEDISVVGFADYACATQIAPRLTTLRMPMQAMGVAAVRLLLARMSVAPGRISLPPQRILLTQTMVERDSTGPASKESWRSRLRR